MKKLSLLVLPPLLSLLLVNCGHSPEPAPHLNSIHAFVTHANYDKTYETYKNEEALASATSSQTSIHVNIRDQRLQLRKGKVVLLDTPVTTGRPGKSTPRGSFRTHDRKVDKQSNVYGQFVQNGRLICSGHRYEQCKGSPGKYEGYDINYWQRLSGGIGLHASNGIKRYPASGGCIRIKPEYAKLIFNKTKSGTRVLIY